MKIEKSSLSVENNHIKFSVPFTKVDVERRLVHGFATLDNVDRQGDVVHADASVRAFQNFAGNIREMHQPIAAGRMVSFREESFYDSETEKFFNGIYVTVYVSKGAPSTWEKVLDGTLKGFSIGGNIVDDTTEYVPDLGKTVRFVKEYELVELSLVDSPANQLANIFSVEKANDGSLMVKGMAAETQTDTIFWCESERIARTSKNDELECSTCGDKMSQIGWFESSENSSEKIQEAVTKYLSGLTNTEEFASETNLSDNTEEDKTSVTEEGGVNVPEERVEAETETVEKAVEVEEVAADAVTEDSDETTETVEEPSSEEEAAEVSEVADVPDFEKMFADLQKSIADGFDSNKSEVEKRFEEVTSTFESKLGELAGKYDELTEKFNALKTGVDGVEKALAARVESVEKSTAVKKSGDLGGSTEEEVSKASSSSWGGAFFAASDL